MRISDWSSDVCSSDLWGLRLEPVILQAAAERYGYVPLDTPKRLENGKGLGGHPDAIVKCPRRGRGILEVKTADWLVAKGWGDEPPLNYLLQIVSYMGLADCDWGDVIVDRKSTRLNSSH